MRKTIFMICLLFCLTLTAWANADAEPFSASVQFEKFSAFIPEGESIRLYGTIEANRPLLRVRAICTDLRSLETFGAYTWETPDDNDIFSLPLYPMRRSLFPTNRPGEFLLVITAESESGSCEVLRQRIFFAGDQPAPANMNDSCEIISSMKHPHYWNDGIGRTKWEANPSGDKIIIRLPQERQAESVYITWFEKPISARVSVYDAMQSLLCETQFDATTFFPQNTNYHLPDGAAEICIETCGQAKVSELYILEKDRIASCVQNWQLPPVKWDLMLVSTHQDDEHIFFGGIIPTYSTRNIEMGIVYMANCGENRYVEALNGLWSVGMRNYSVFLGLDDGLIKSKTSALAVWDGEEHVTQLLVAQIRKYRPEVVLTHDFAGEYKNYQHMVTAECVAKAVEAAADPSYQLDAPSEPWQVKKLYVHLYALGEIDFDWDIPLESFDNMTALELSRAAYTFHRGQQKLVSYNLGRKYDNSRFGLYATTVGPDTGLCDLFENIPIP